MHNGGTGQGSARGRRQDFNRRAQTAGPEAAPSPTWQLQLLQRRAGNRAVLGLLAGVQPRLDVGASNDPFEREADAVGRQVVAAMRSGRTYATPAAQADDAAGPKGAPVISRRAQVGAEGGTVSSDIERTISSTRGRGVELDETTRRKLDSGFGADFSQVRVHTGSQATELNQQLSAEAFTLGNDIYFRDGLPDANSSGGLELLAHELTHTIQQGGARRVASAPEGEHQQMHEHDSPSISRAWSGSCCGEILSDGTVIRRHSSWEHSLLGDAKPATLVKIGAWQDLIEQTSADGGKLAKGKVTIQGVGDVDKAQVMHVLTQEMSRVALWQTNPPKAASTDDAMNVADKDPTFGVTVVRLPAAKADKQQLVTYGELNTLADFYGSLEVMQAADPAKRNEIVQSVRKETFLRLREIFEKLQDSLTRTESESADVRGAERDFYRKRLGVDEEGDEQVTFKGAATPDFISGVSGQADLLAGDKPLIGQGTGAKGGDTNKYGATLARNACHFVPESWHSWADYHAKAVALAVESNKLFGEVQAAQQAMAKQDFSRRPLIRTPHLDAISR